MRLTLNTIEYEGRKLYQVARLNMKTYKEELGGYVESRANLPTDMENSWIAPGAKVLGSTRLCGRVVIRDNAIVENCLLSGIIVIGHGAVLDGCEIHNDGPANAALFIERGSVIKRRCFKGVGTYKKELFTQTGFKYQQKHGVDLITTDQMCKVGCLDLTYTDAWKFVNDDNKWQELKQKYKDAPQTFTEQARKWLREECLAQLNKGKIKR